MNPTQPSTAGAVTPATPADALRRAAAYLIDNGWTPDGFYADDSPTPPASALGAIRFVICGHPVTHPSEYDDLDRIADVIDAMEAMADYIDPGWHCGGWPRESIADFNDANGRTREQVVAALNAAADLWDRTHGGAR